MKRAFTITILFISTVTVLAQYNYRWIDVPINNQKDWTYLEYLDSLSKDPVLNKYHTRDINTVSTYSEINWVDSTYQHAPRPHSVRLSFAVSNDYRTLVPIAISPNRVFIKYYSWHHPELASDSIGFEPLYIVPITEYWTQLTGEDQSRLMGIYKVLLNEAIFDRIYSDGERFNCLKIHDLIVSKLFDERKLESMQYVIPWKASPLQNKKMSTSDVQRITNPLDTIWHGSRSVIINNAFKVKDCLIYANMELEKKEIQVMEHKGQFSFVFEPNIIGFEMHSRTKRNQGSVIWTNKTELIEKMECPPLLKGIDYLWAEKLERKMKK